MKLFSLIIFSIVALSFSSFNAKAADYTQTCMTDACLHDGRYHLVYSVESSGSISPGSGTIAALNSYILAGADVKIVTFNGNEKCQNVYKGTNKNSKEVVYCLTPTRFANDGVYLPVTFGTARYGTDGSVFCSSKDNPATDNCANLGLFKIQWYVKF